MLRRFRDVFASLLSHRVKYVVIGGIAAVAHGVPRATFDLDILMEATEENADRLPMALRSCGFGTAHLISASELLRHEITIFKDRLRVDVQTSTPGIDFADAWKHHRELVIGDTIFFVVSREDMFRSKNASGRKVDLEDVEALGDEPKSS
jgi:hypothetical protein